MTHRDDLVALITNGTSPSDIYVYFITERHLSRPSIIGLLNQAGVTFRLPPSGDEISDERRLELQQLSTS